MPRRTFLHSNFTKNTVREIENKRSTKWELLFFILPAFFFLVYLVAESNINYDIVGTWFN
jgi:hypothetical protein